MLLLAIAIQLVPVSGAVARPARAPAGVLLGEGPLVAAFLGAPAPRVAAPIPTQAVEAGPAAALVDGLRRSVDAPARRVRLVCGWSVLSQAPPATA